MKKEVKDFVDEFLKNLNERPIRIISHYDTDGITSASILIKTFQRMNLKFSVRIVKSLDQNILEEELKRQPKEVIVFSDLGSGNLKHFQNLKDKIFILDHHELDKNLLNDKIVILNPHLSENPKENEVTGAGVCYLFSKEISPKNKDLSKLAVIGMIGDRYESEISKTNQEIVNDCSELEIKKGPVLYPATRQLRRALEYSTNPYIPGVTGNSQGALELLKQAGISYEKSLLDLSEEEMSRLITQIMIRMAKNINEQTEILGNLFILKFFNTLEDVREISVLVNACSRLGHPDVAIAYCLENPNAKSQALEIYTRYKQELVSGLRIAEQIEKIKGKGFVIINAQDKIKDTIIGTVCSMISSSPVYDEGTVLIGMAYDKDRIKVSARMVGRKGRNLKEVLDKAVVEIKRLDPEANIEVGGHHYAAGCVIDKDKESLLLKVLKESLEIEVMKVA